MVGRAFLLLVLVAVFIWALSGLLRDSRRR
jgi:hypothetical protein